MSQVTEALLHLDKETIVAQCTPKGSGAIALIRLSGSNAIEIAEKITVLKSKKKLSQESSHTIHYGWIVTKGNTKIDQVLLLLMKEPKTFTGEDTVEITCHNNPFIIEAIITEAIENGARIAQNGEFTKRAFLNKKIDLIQAEAINELIHAQTETALKSSLQQLEGTLTSWALEIEKDLIKALSLSEASFEFLDEEQMEFSKEIETLLSKSIKTIDSLKQTFNQQQQIRQGIRIAIIGSVNAGKSSLFNALLNQKRAIVTNIAGTTRDSIEAGIYKYGNYITLIDTAGLRQTENSIEKKGIQRSLEEAKKADIILLAYDGSKKMLQDEQKIYHAIIEAHNNKIILVQNKIDKEICCNQFPTIKKIGISSLHNTNIDVLKKEIHHKINALFAAIDSPFLLNKRQYNLITGLENRLKAMIPMLEDQVAYELISYHLHNALEYFSEFSGKTISTKGLDAIFREFCIGK